MPAAFDFINYKINHFQFQAGDDAPPAQLEHNVSVEARLDRNDENPSIFRLVLNIKVAGDPSIDLEIFGFFKWNGEYISKETEYCLHTSGASVLYPYARAAISTFTALDGRSPIVLQTMNFYDLVDGMNQVDEKCTPTVI